MRWIAGGILLLIAAVALKLTLLVYAFGTGLLLFLGARGLAHRWSTGIVAHRHCDTTLAVIGQTLTVKVEIENRGRWPATWLFCEELIPVRADGRLRKALQIRGEHAGVFSLAAGAKRQWEYQCLPNRRGYFQIGPLVLETGDFLGINRKFRVLCDPHYITVHPEMVPLRGYHIESRRPIGEIVMSHRLFEDPTRISGVRDYQAGDALARVHWRATARAGKLQSKVFQPSSLAGATLVIDFHEESFAAQDEPVRSELTITAAASLANALFQMNQQFGLLSNGRDAIDRVRTEGYQGDARTRSESQQSVTMKAESDRLQPVIQKTGKQPDRMRRMLDNLARLEKTNGLTLVDLLTGFTSHLPRDATVVVFLSRVNLERALGLAYLRRQGYAVTAIINTDDDEHYQHAAGILLNHGIAARHLSDSLSIAALCREQLTGRTG